MYIQTNSMIKATPKSENIGLQFKWALVVLTIRLASDLISKHNLHSILFLVYKMGIV